jgi:long-chain acyl-CoA synthetase
MFDAAASRYSQNTCTYFFGKIFKYEEINNQVVKAAAGLQKLGVVKGTRVGLLLPNMPEFIVFYFAILKAGGIVVNYNPLYTVPELLRQVEDSGTEVMISLDLGVVFNKVESLLARDALAKAVICSFAGSLPPLKASLFRLFKAGKLANIPRSSQIGKIVTQEKLLDNDGAFTQTPIDPEKDIAVLQYTGGTTGIPKGAALTHANLTTNVQQINILTAGIFSEDEKMFGVLPLFHVFAMTAVMNFGINLGAEIVLMPKFELADALRLIKKRRPSIMPGVPTMYNAMLNHPKIGSHDLSALKFCISGGAALPAEVKRGFEKISGCTLVEGYGLSETSPVVTCNPLAGETVEGSIGLPLSDTKVEIRSLDDPSQVMPAGENGELCVKGPQVMTRYWNAPGETADSFIGDFFRTGDVGYVDASGFIYIVDRIKDMINCAGFKVYPRMIEEAIYQHPAVAEVTVVGIYDEYRGEAPKAFIKCHPNRTASTEEIIEFLREKISKIEMPEQIEFRDELPKTMIGKLSKKELR